MYAILINYLGRYSRVITVFGVAAVILLAVPYIKESSLPFVDLSRSGVFSSKKDALIVDKAALRAKDSDKTSRSELEKLLHTINLAKNQKADIIFDGRNYTPFEMKVWARQYLKRNFTEGETAVEWVEKNTYRTEEGNIIYFRYKDGTQKPMRDVFLELLSKGHPRN